MSRQEMPLPGPSIALEITPPAREKAAILLRRARSLGGLSQRINVIQRSGRWSSLSASIALRRAGLDPVWHLVNRGRSAEEIGCEIAQARRHGIRGALCIRGEYKRRDSIDTPKIRELVRRLRDDSPEIQVCVSANQHLSRERVLKNLWPKIQAGANQVQTQVALDLSSLDPLAAAIKDRYPETQITPMVFPVLSRDAAVRLAQRLSLPLPPGSAEALERGGEEAGWRLFAALLDQIAASPLYSGVAIMTAMDPLPAHAQRLRALLTTRFRPVRTAAHGAP